MRNKTADMGELDKARLGDTSAYPFPASSTGKLTKAIEQESIFRQISTVLLSPMDTT